MGSTVNKSPILNHAAAESRTQRPPDGVLDELSQLASAHDAVAIRAASLFQQLRKMLGQSRLTTCLLGLQYLAARNDPDGARLLAAFLDVSTTGARLIPRVRDFSSSRRLQLSRICTNDPNPFCNDWLRRLADLTDRAEAHLIEREVSLPPTSSNPGCEKPWPVLRRTLKDLLDKARSEQTPDLPSRRLLVDLFRLEVDAWQERISQLAGEIDPFRMSAVIRVLPMLNRVDAEVRDLRQLIIWVEEGDYEAVFRRQQSRALEVMDEREHAQLVSALASSPSLKPLAELYSRLAPNPLPIPLLAAGAARLMALRDQLRLLSFDLPELDLLTAVSLVQTHAQGRELAIPVDQELGEILGGILMAPRLGSGAGSWSLDGLALTDEQLVLSFPSLGLGDRLWANDLPTPDESDPSLKPPVPAGAGDETQDSASSDDEPEEDEAGEDQSAAAIKQLVMNSLNSVSILLGFLRNPKIVAIPGLVAEVAARARNPQIIETIATDRALYTGFANREVPLTCLRSPCNVSVKILRKFIHVKYVTKIDLKRMAADKAGFRREVIREIEKYLETLT